MRNVHLVICDLFLPADFAAEVCADLRLPALEKMLARGASTGSGRTGGGGASLEDHLCELFGVPCRPNAPIAPISAVFDGLGGGCDTLLTKSADCGSSRQAALPAPEGSASPCQGGRCWLRADPVHLRLQRDQLILLPEVEIRAEEAAQLCAALNEHFVGQGMEFFAPHPQRWYLRLDRLPDIETVPLSQAAGRDVRGLLPKGREAAQWHRVFNDIQMLLHSHPLNEAREARGALPVNSLWLWGGGCDTLLAKPADCGSSRQAALPAPEGFVSPCQGGGCGTTVMPQETYDSVSSDEVLAEMFAAAAGIPFSSWSEQWRDVGGDRQLLVWTGLRSALRRGDLVAWRTALQEFEVNHAQPLWQALRAGKISGLRMDVFGGGHVRHFLLSRTDAWAFWRRGVPLAEYSMV